MSDKHFGTELMNNVVHKFRDPFRSFSMENWATVSGEPMLKSANFIITQSTFVIILRRSIPSLSHSVLGPLGANSRRPRHGTFFTIIGEHRRPQRLQPNPAIVFGSFIEHGLGPILFSDVPVQQLF